MFLDYRLSEDWDENSTDLATADETDLRYYAATGDIILRNNEIDLSARWGWIPLVDFALALRDIIKALEDAEGSQTFEFTESEATFQLNRSGQEIVISASFAPGEIAVRFPEFKQQARDFARRLDAELLAKRPELMLNQVYQEFKLSGLSA
jgi:hypothetical protein